MRPGGRSSIFGCASVLLSYPEADLSQDLVAVEQVLCGLASVPAASQLRRVAQWLGSMEQGEAAKTYVQVFDLSERVCLHLTYYRYGDTRSVGWPWQPSWRRSRGRGSRWSPASCPTISLRCWSSRRRVRRGLRCSASTAWRSMHCTLHWSSSTRRMPTWWTPSGASCRDRRAGTGMPSGSTARRAAVGEGRAGTVRAA